MTDWQEIIHKFKTTWPKMHERRMAEEIIRLTEIIDTQAKQLSHERGILNLEIDRLKNEVDFFKNGSERIHAH